MRKYISTWSMLVLFGLAVLWSGCGGPSTEVAPVERLGTTTAPEAPDTSIAVPEWFLNVPEDPNYVYTATSGTSRDLQMALDNAKHQGRLDIASQMSTKVAGIFKRFREEIGAEEDSELLAMTTSASKEIVSEVVKGVRTARQDVKKEGKLYRSYVLMEMPIGEVNTALMDKVKDTKNMYTRFRASQGFKELEAEVEKYEDWKKEQGAE